MHESISKIEAAATLVGLDLVPSEKDKEPESFGIDISAIITIVMGLIQQLLENCPESAATTAAAFKKPTLRQRAALRLRVYDACEFCNPSVRRLSESMYQSLLSRGSKLTDEEARGLVEEARGGSAYSII